MSLFEAIRRRIWPHDARWHLRKLDDAIRRTCDALEVQEREFIQDGVCCPGCMFGEARSRLETKLERQLEWREVLRKKIGK